MANSKMKTHKGVKKRVKVTGSGKVKHRRSGKSHLNSCHGGKFIREKKKDMVASKPIEKELKLLLKGH